MFCCLPKFVFNNLPVEQYTYSFNIFFLKTCFLLFSYPTVLYAYYKMFDNLTKADPKIIVFKKLLLIYYNTSIIVIIS